MKVARLELIEGPDCVAGLGETVADDKPVTSVSTEIQQLLWNMVEKSGEALNNKLQDQVYKAFAWILTLTSKDMGGTTQLQHTVPTTTKCPIRQQARRVPPFRCEEVNKLLQDMLARDAIQSSASPWASPIVLVQKKDGSIRFCVDCRKLDARMPTHFHASMTRLTHWQAHTGSQPWIY